MKKLIFVDLDETLIHTFMPAWDEFPSEDATTVFLGPSEQYDTVLRQGAIHFLHLLRSKGQVYMLTAATNDYANAMNKTFELGFNSNQIFSREDIQSGQLDPTFFGKGTVYLFDNLPRHENHSKIRFLRPLGEVKYIQVAEFYNNQVSRHYTHDHIDELIARIE